MIPPVGRRRARPESDSGQPDGVVVYRINLMNIRLQGITTGASFIGTVGMYLAQVVAVLGREDEANGLLERADAQLRALEAPFWQARNAVEWAGLLASRRTPSDLTHARELLAGAEAMAAKFDGGGVERRAHELATRLA
jgi:hypothetical protein